MRSASLLGLGKFLPSGHPMPKSLAELFSIYLENVPPGNPQKQQIIEAAKKAS